MPNILVKGGKPVAVLIDLDQYENMLKRLEDTEAIAMLQRVRADVQRTEPA